MSLQMYLPGPMPLASEYPLTVKLWDPFTVSLMDFELDVLLLLLLLVVVIMVRASGVIRLNWCDVIIRVLLVVVVVI